MEVSGQDIFSPMRDIYCVPGVNGTAPPKGAQAEIGVFPWTQRTTSTSSTDPESKLTVNTRSLFKFKVPIINRYKIKVFFGARYVAGRIQF